MKLEGVDIKRCKNDTLLKYYRQYLLFLVPGYSLFAAFLAGVFLLLQFITAEMPKEMGAVSFIALIGAALFVWLVVIFIKRAKCIKAELNLRTVTKEQEEYAKNSLKTLIKITIGVVVATIIITLIVVSGASGGSSYTGKEKCRNCGRTVKIVPGYGYCYDCFDGYLDWEKRNNK